MMESKSLEKWRHELKSIGRKHWLVFYKDQMGTTVSSIPRLYKAISNYGEWVVFDAILASSEKQLNGDPLNYVLAVANAKWKEEQEAEDSSEEYDTKIKEAIQETEKDSQALSDKLRKLDVNNKNL